MENSTALQSKNAQALVASKRQAFGWRSSLLLFGIPALAFFVSFHAFRPWLETQGYNPLISYLASLCLPMALMFAAALVAYHRVEGCPLTREAFARRMRYPKLTWRDGFWVLVILVGGFLGYGLLTQVSQVLLDTGMVPLPAGLPLLANPKAVFSPEALDQSAGGQILGQWDLVILFTVTLFFNIAGEEFWWRGFILPHQEAAWGGRTWIFHGLLWAFFHAFKWWDILSLVPVCLLIAYSAQRTKSNWAALIAHLLFNITGYVLVFLAVAGI